MHMNNAITLSAHKSSESIVYMQPGDSLQLLYFFELFHQWATGKTPWFYNLYEFHTGDDAERYSPDIYYAPFTLFYSAARLLSTQALGMNAAGIISLWLTLLATWLLLRRYTKDEWIVALFSIFVLIFPYRWKALFDASPTGFAMMWVPVLILGLDLAVRDGKLRGGIVAGLAILFMYLGDAHVFFFGMLLIPAWCMLALLADSGLSGQAGSRYGQIVLALTPAALVGLSMVFAVRRTAKSLSETAMGQGRDLGEVAVFSPQASGFFTWQSGDISSQVYLGWAIVALIIVGLVLLFLNFLRDPRQQLNPLLFMSLLCLGILGMAILALGPHGLRSGGLFTLVRELIPPYAMIRQAGKIFCIMPTLLAIAGVIALTALVKAGSAKPWWHGFCVMLVAVPIYWDYSTLSKPDLIYLPKEQPAYQAVAEDALSRGENPHILVVTLWPGDSHYAALYQHFALMYRIRMLNGYSPAVSKTYFNDIFMPLQSINQGYLSMEQISALRGMGIGHIMVHENLYPEKVAPFPVSYALKRFLEHPSLQFLARGHSVWAFRILDAPEKQAREQHEMVWDLRTPLFPARHWEMERSLYEHAALVEDASASGRNFIALSKDGAVVHLAQTGTPPAPDLRWMIRCRGQGLLRVEVFAGHDLLGEELLTLKNQDWQWLELPLSIETYSNVSVRLALEAGNIDLDSALLTAGKWPFLQPGELITIPAASFFRAGFTDLSQQQVTFLTKYYAEKVVFYGPRMPLEPGLYEVSMEYSADAAPGVEIGALRITSDANIMGKKVAPLFQGQDWRFEVLVENNLPFNMDLFFTGQADLVLNEVTFRRLE